MAEKKKLRTYKSGALDGQHEFVVAADNQVEACKILGVSENYFKNHGGRKTDDPTLVSLANSTPKQVWKRKLSFVPGHQNAWVPDIPKEKKR